MISTSWRHDINFKRKYLDLSYNTIKVLYWVHDISTTFLCYRSQDINNKAIAASMLVFRWTGFRLTLVSVVLVTAVVVSTLLLVKDPGKNYSGAPPYGQFVITASHFFTYRRNAPTLSVCHRDVAIWQHSEIATSVDCYDFAPFRRPLGPAVFIAFQYKCCMIWLKFGSSYKIISASRMLIKEQVFVTSLKTSLNLDQSLNLTLLR